MKRRPKKITLSWADVDKGCKSIVRQAQKYRRMIKNVYGVPRGGLMVAVRVSHLMNIPVLLNKDRIAWNTLVVDDIIDSGDTLQRLLRGKKRFAVATLALNVDTKKILPDLTPSFTKREGDWIYFPWETKTSSKYDKTV